MEFLASWRAIAGGLIVALFSLLVARDYLRPVVPAARPGLMLHAEPTFPVEPDPHSRLVGRLALALGALGLALAAVAGLLLLRAPR